MLIIAQVCRKFGIVFAEFSARGDDIASSFDTRGH